MPCEGRNRHVLYKLFLSDAYADYSAPIRAVNALAIAALTLAMLVMPVYLMWYGATKM